MILPLRAGRASAEVDLVAGGRLRSLRVDDRELLVGPPGEGDRSIFWGCFLMAPWVGRMASGILEWGGRRLVFSANLEHHAIHGLVFDKTWAVEAQDAKTISLRCSLREVGWPFGGSVLQRIGLEEGQLSLTAEILADQPSPAALGWHPWFRRSRGDERIVVNASEVLETGPDRIPSGKTVRVDEITDLRSGAAIGSRLLDHTYVHPVPPALLRTEGVDLSLWFEPPINAVLVHTRSEAFCVEPQTSWPNAAALEYSGIGGTGLRTLRAGEALKASCQLRWG
jgi:galactose mutarotase-like enzyme